MKRFSMREVRKETIRIVWEKALSNPNRYPDSIVLFPTYAKKVVAEKLRKKTREWRRSRGFTGTFRLSKVYTYRDKEEVVEEKRCQ